MPELFGLDAYSPKEIAARVSSVGVTKARMPLVPMTMLGILAGAFIALGALYFTLITSDPSVGRALARLLGGLVFAMGLIMVVVAGGELFTGNNLLVMAWADRQITTGELLRNWVVVYVANAIGAFGVVALAWLAGMAHWNEGAVARQVLRIAVAKSQLPFSEAFFAGVLCNVLVCMAVWLAMAGRSVTDKILAILLPISAFVAAGFEHSVANFYFLGLGLLINSRAATEAITPDPALTGMGLVTNLVPVTLGNIVGGGVLVALVYYVIYRRGAQ
jgi:formate/nitrite transporter